MFLVVLFVGLVMIGLTSVADVDFIEGLFLVGGVVGVCYFAEVRLLSAAAKLHLREPRNLVPWLVGWLAAAFGIYQLFKAGGSDHAAAQIERTGFLVMFPLSAWLAMPLLTVVALLLDRRGFFERLGGAGSGGGAEYEIEIEDEVEIEEDTGLDYDPTRYRRPPPVVDITPPVSAPTPEPFSPHRPTLH